MKRVAAMAVFFAFLGTAVWGEVAFRLPERWAKGVVISPEGSVFAVTTVNGVYLFRFEEVIEPGVEDPLAGGLKLGLPGYVHCVDFSPDGRLVAAGGWSMVRVWDVARGEEVATIEFQGFVYTLSFTPTRNLLLGLSGGDVILYDIEKHEVVWERKLHSGAVWGVAASPDGKLAASGGAEEGLLFRLADAEVLFEFPGHAWDVGFTPDGYLLGVGAGKVFEIYDTATGFPYFSAQRHHGCIWGVSFSPDGKHAATASLDGTVILWDVVEGKDLQVLGEGTESIEDVDLDGKYLVACRRDGTVYIWNLRELLEGNVG